MGPLGTSLFQPQWQGCAQSLPVLNTSYAPHPQSNTLPGEGRSDYMWQGQNWEGTAHSWGGSGNPVEREKTQGWSLGGSILPCPLLQTGKIKSQSPKSKELQISGSFTKKKANKWRGHCIALLAPESLGCRQTCFSLLPGGLQPFGVQSS